MKEVFISVVLLVLSLNTVNAQEVVTVNLDGNGVKVASGSPTQKAVGTASMEFFYDYRYLADTTDVSSAKNDLMVLQVAPGMSKFFSYRTMQIDSLIRVSTANEIMANPGRYAGGETFAVYKNYPAGKITYTDKISKDWFKYEEEIPAYEWELMEEEKEIEGYVCRRAECSFRGRRYIAWYTNEIAVADGPWKFSGLPGFIMQVADSEGHYSFVLSGIRSNIAKEITVTDTKFYTTSRKKYLQTRELFDTNPIEYMARVSGINVIIKHEDGTPNTEAMASRVLKYDYMERGYK